MTDFLLRKIFIVIKFAPRVFARKSAGRKPPVKYFYLLDYGDFLITIKFRRKLNSFKFLEISIDIYNLCFKHGK